MTKTAATKNRRPDWRVPLADQRLLSVADDSERFIVCRLCGRQLRAVNNVHLRAAHGYQGKHPVYDYERKFALPVAMCGNSRIGISVRMTAFWKDALDDEINQIRENMSASREQHWEALPQADRELFAGKMSAAKTRYWEKLGQHWTRDRVLTQMRQRLQDGLSLRKSSVPQELHAAAMREFGSWKAAVETLGLNYDDVTGARRWTRQKLIAAIQKLHAAGVDLASGHIRRRHQALYAAAMKLFPHSWAKALRAARINPRDYMTPRTRWSRELAAAWVQTRNAKGHSILVRDAPEGLQAFLRRELRLRYSDFVESLGIPYPGVKHRHDWSRQMVLSEIRTWKAEGHHTNVTTIAHEYPALLHQARKYFKSWERACAAAGVAVERLRRGGRAKWSRELVVSEIRRRKEEGRPAHCAAVVKDYQNLYKQGRKFFGSWDAACIAAGVGVQRLQQAAR